MVYETRIEMTESVNDGDYHWLRRQRKEDEKEEAGLGDLAV